MPDILPVSAWGPDGLLAMLERHPRVRLRSFEEAESARILFFDGGREREAAQGERFPGAPYGLVELMDNNPLVCAEAASCTGPAATLALIAAGPPARAELLVDRPAIVLSFEAGFDEVDAALATEGWHDGASATCVPADGSGALAATCLCEVQGDVQIAEMESLYDECFARSFFVRRHAGGEWAGELVANAAHALYRLAVSGGEAGHAVLRVDVISNPNGKAGSGHLVHLMNVMAGLEEYLGLTS